MAGLARLVFLLLVLLAGLSDDTIGMTGIFLANCFVFPLPFFFTGAAVCSPAKGISMEFDSG
jgi:hypothetical protein